MRRQRDDWGAGDRDSVSGCYERVRREGRGNNRAAASARLPFAGGPRDQGKANTSEGAVFPLSTNSIWRSAASLSSTVFDTQQSRGAKILMPRM